MIFVVGALVGSFAGLSIYRIPLRQSIIVPDSHCPHCNTLLAAKDLMPIISWLWLRGKCRYCRERIARRELLVEVVSGILYVAVYWQIGGSIMLLPSLIFIYFLLVVAWIDYDCQLIFNKVMAAMLAGGMMLKLLVMQNRGEVESGGVFLSGGDRQLVWLCRRRRFDVFALYDQRRHGLRRCLVCRGNGILAGSGESFIDAFFIIWAWRDHRQFAAVISC